MTVDTLQCVVRGDGNGGVRVEIPACVLPAGEALALARKIAREAKWEQFVIPGPNYRGKREEAES